MTRYDTEQSKDTPFSNAEKHILHAYEIAPRGCKIIALCNSETINNTHTQARKELKNIIESIAGTITDLGQCFEQAERKTGVNVSMIKVKKPGVSYSQEFEGFFMDEEPEETEGNGIIKHLLEHCCWLHPTYLCL